MVKKKIKRKNPIAKDLRTPKYKLQMVKNKKLYDRKKKTNTKNPHLDN
tara:strand:- start:266 stop:409 length:144 start_codon:yes stop_codon:yes gene_type:complete